MTVDLTHSTSSARFSNATCSLGAGPDGAIRARRDFSRLGRHSEPVALGYQRLASMLWNTGFVTGIHADVALPHDDFDFQHGTEAFLRHKPTGKDGPEVTPLWAYAHIQFQFGQAKGEAFRVMPWHDVMRIRDASQAYQRALDAKIEAEKKGWGLPKAWKMAPWVRFEREMAAKTPFRKIQKYLKKSPEVAYALDLEDRQDLAGTLDFSNVIEQGPEAVQEPPEERSTGAAIAQEHRAPDPLASFGQRQTPVERQAAPAPARRAADPADEVPPYLTEAPPPEDDGPAAAAPAPQASAPQPRDMWDLFDAAGDLSGSFPSPKAWCAAFVREFDLAQQDGTLKEFISFNADRIEQARAFPDLRDQLADLIPTETGDGEDAGPREEDAPRAFAPPHWPELPRKRNGTIDDKGAEKYIESAFLLANSAEEIDAVMTSVPAAWLEHNTILLLARRGRASRCRHLGIAQQESPGA